MSALHGLVLAGGRSRRMMADKAALTFDREPELARSFGLLASRVARTWVSVRADQADEPLRASFPRIVDGGRGEGPVAGILAAQAAHPDVAWLVVACDLPLLDGGTLDQLLAGRDPGAVATAFRSTHDGLPEPLCAIWEPASRQPLGDYVAAGGICPRKFLVAQGATLLSPLHPRALDNANTPADAAAIRAALAVAGAR